MQNGSAIAGTKDIHVIEKHGFRFGFMGLAEIDWVTTLHCVDLEELDYEDFITAGNRLSKLLRDTHKCDFVVALTHLRNPNDKLLASHSSGIDFILGGHDHVDTCSPDLPLAEVPRRTLSQIRNRLSKHV